MVIFSQNKIATDIEKWLKERFYSKLIIICDENTRFHCLPLIANAVADAQILLIGSGEKYKNLETCQEIWHTLSKQNTDRKALCINLGGGVVGDMGGFCASTYKRGIDFVQIPTTLLSQVDASVGGKVGIDFENYKNQIGVFALPKAVFIDTQFLDTLPPKEWLSGFAEVVKHCLIADKDAWQQMRAADISLHQQNINLWVSHSVAIKTTITEQDPTEQGIRKLLNFGHTIGHALESYFLGTPQMLLHGEAIALGMLAEAFISNKKQMLSTHELEDITHYICQYYPNIKLQKNDIEKVIAFTYQDKKNISGKLKFTLLQKIGQGIYDVDTTETEVYESLDYLSHMA